MTSNRKPTKQSRSPRRRRRVALGVSVLLAIPLLAVIAPSAANADPSAPTDVAATAGAGSATVTWAAPDGGWSGGDGPDDVWAYQINAYVGSTLDTSTTVTAESTSTQSDVFTGLSNGTAYTFTVQDISGDWFDPPYTYSDESAPSNAVTPSNTPSAPTDVTATASSSVAGQIQVSWTAPSNNGGSGIDHYTVTPSSGSAQTVTGSSTSTYFDGLSGGYTFTVTATNSTGGTSAASAASGTAVAPTVSAAPTGVSATAAPGQATVTWTAPGGGHSDNSYPNGNWIYTINAYSGGTLQTSTQGGGSSGASQSAVVTGLTGHGNYTFTVIANSGPWDDQQSSPESSASSVVTIPIAPSAPTDVVASPDTNYGDRALVSWNAPSTAGDGGLSTYTVTASNGATQTVSSADTSTAFTGLTAGESYTFTVKATDADGDTGTASSASNSVEVGDPDVPTGVNATVNDDGSVTVGWTDPGGAYSGDPDNIYHPTYYVIRAYWEGSLLAETYDDGPSSFDDANQSYTITDLPMSDFGFTFTVSAIDGHWDGPWYYGTESTPSDLVGGS